MRLPAGSSYYTASNTLLLPVRWRCCAVRLLRSGTTSTAISYYLAHTLQQNSYVLSLSVA
jgi:hypothetical protein